MTVKQETDIIQRLLTEILSNREADALLTQTGDHAGWQNFLSIFLEVILEKRNDVLLSELLDFHKLGHYTKTFEEAKPVIIDELALLFVKGEEGDCARYLHALKDPEFEHAVHFHRMTSDAIKSIEREDLKKILGQLEMAGDSEIDEVDIQKALTIIERKRIRKRLENLHKETQVAPSKPVLAKVHGTFTIGSENSVNKDYAFGGSVKSRYSVAWSAAAIFIVFAVAGYAVFILLTQNSNINVDTIAQIQHTEFKDSIDKKDTVTFKKLVASNIDTFSFETKSIIEKQYGFSSSSTKSESVLITIVNLAPRIDSLQKLLDNELSGSGRSGMGPIAWHLSHELDSLKKLSGSYDYSEGYRVFDEVYKPQLVIYSVLLAPNKQSMDLIKIVYLEKDDSVDIYLKVSKDYFHIVPTRKMINKTPVASPKEFRFDCLNCYRKLAPERNQDVLDRIMMFE
jgi:hypothetical protein